MSRLDDIVEDVRQEMRRRQQGTSLDALETSIAHCEPPKRFARCLESASSLGYGVICEIKRASPSKGWIRQYLDSVEAAQLLESGGATCLSVLTEQNHFHGSPEDLERVRASSSLPLLRKDFMVDPWQIAESRLMGADCVLLIMTVLDDGQAGELAEAARRWDLDVLAEVHNAEEVERALALSPDMVGINNRDLTTFETDLAVTERLSSLIDEETLTVSESGIETSWDMHRLADCGVRCFLVGESLMRQNDLAAAIHDLLED